MTTTYQYVAWSDDGTRHEGVKQSPTQDDVLDWLQKQNLTPVSVNAVSDNVGRKKKYVRPQKIKSGELSTFCWQLSTMIDGGMPIATAMETIGSESENPYLGHILTEIATNIKRGETLSDSVRQFPKIFNNLACSMVVAAESGGSLPETLTRLADYYENKDKLARKVKGALSYPIFVVCFIILIIVAMMTFVIPTFSTMFDQMGGKLPAFTKAFMGFYYFTRSHVLHIIGTVFTIFLSIFIFSKTKKGHSAISKFMLKLPLFGKLISMAFVATFCKTLSTLLDSGVPALEAFQILSTMTNNEHLQNAVLKTRDHITEGSGISQSMAATKFFPNIAVKMTQIGEDSGSLPAVLDKTSDYYEIKVEAILSTLLGMIEPILIVTVGAIVLTVILAMYLPIFTMGKH